MGKRHNTLSDEIFRNSKYIKMLEKEFKIENFKKEYKEQYDIMLDIFKNLILVNNIVFADSDRTIEDKITDLEIQLEECLYGTKDNDSVGYKYSVRKINGLFDKYSRHLYKRFSEWYEYLQNSNKLDLIKNDIEEEMTKLDNVGFDNIVKDDMNYEKNKNSNHKIYVSKFDSLLYKGSINEIIDKYKKDFSNDYGVELNDSQFQDIALIYILIACANNGIVKVLNESKELEFDLKENSLPQDIFKAYLTSLNINSDSYSFKTDSLVFMIRILKIYNIIGSKVSFDSLINNFDILFFFNNMETINKEISIKNDYINKILYDLDRIHKIMIKKVNSMEEMFDNYKNAFDRVQVLIQRNNEYFERMS